MTVALAECDGCGIRAPLREMFSTEALIEHATRPGAYEPMVGLCACGGTVREDLETTVAALMEFVAGDDDGA